MPALPNELPPKPTVFVTGATGFVGSHLVEELRRRGYGEIRCLVRSRLRWLEGMDVVPVGGDLFQVDPLLEALSGVDYVYHVGGVTRARSWSVYERENVEASLRLLEAVVVAAPSVRRVVMTSSLAAVGRCVGGVADEDTPLRPVSSYGRSKAEMEMAIAAPRESDPPFQDQLPITVVRPPSVYGPREADIYTMFKSASRGFFPMMGTGSTPDVSLVHVRDLVRGMVDAAEAPAAVARTYFIGSDQFYSWREVHRGMSAALGRSSVAIPVPPFLVGSIGMLAEAAGKVIGTYPPLNREKAREARWACKMCHNRRAAADFGYQQRIRLEEGFAETVDWYRQQGWL